jgi:dCTP deaminase
MPFWSGSTLEKRIPEHSIIDNFDPSRIDCAAYRLRLGSECYSTSDDQKWYSRRRKIDRLEPGDDFTIPSGQFAFLLTEEKVTLPTSALGFISLRSEIKFRGLINVSGFHVDPGFSGKLTFAVYNAGPNDITIRRGSEIFLLWIAELDSSEPRHAKDMHEPIMSLSERVVNNNSSDQKTISSLYKRMDKLEKLANGRLTLYTVIGGIIVLSVTVLVTLSTSDTLRDLMLSILLDGNSVD